MVRRSTSTDERRVLHPLVPRREHQGVRRRLHEDDLILYEVSDGHVRIIHVLHGAMDCEKILFPESRDGRRYMPTHPAIEVTQGAR